MPELEVKVSNGSDRLRQGIFWFIGSFVASQAAAIGWWQALVLTAKGEPPYLGAFIALLAAIQVFLFVVTCGLWAILRRALPHLKSKPYVVESDPFMRSAAVVADVRGRAIRLRRNAALSLLIMISALAAGLLLFYKAEDLSSDAITRLSEAVFRLRIDNRYATRGLKEELEYYRRGRMRRDFLAERDVSLAIAEIEGIGRQLEAATTDMDKKLAALNSGDQTRRFVSTITTRVGAVLILVFLV